MHRNTDARAQRIMDNDGVITASWEHSLRWYVGMQKIKICEV